MITFATERLADVLPELEPMFAEHWAELALNRDKVPLLPQYHVYLDREERGELLMLIGRSEGKVAAYFVGFIAPGLHYSTCLTLTMDIFWVAPQHRTGSTGVRLFRAMETEARRRGVQRLFVGSKLHKDASALFRRLKYEPVETYYSAWLGD